jgi:hypothetical protein
MISLTRLLRALSSRRTVWVLVLSFLVGIAFLLISLFSFLGFEVFCFLLPAVWVSAGEVGRFYSLSLS